MNWYKGNIAEAVAESKAKNAIFVVYVEGKDEASAKLSSFLNEPIIYNKLATGNFISIKIESDSQSYMQFASIYQMVPVPSIFFIGDSGTPLEIGTGILVDVQELERKIDRVLSLTGKAPAATASADLLGAERQAAASAAAPSTSSKPADAEKNREEEEVVCDGDVCYKKPKEAVKETAKEEPKETAKEEPKEASKDSPKESTQEAPKVALQEAPKVAPQEAPKETPKEAPKEAPKETPKEAPKESPQETPTESPKESPEEQSPTADSAESPQAATERAEAMEHALKVIEQKRLERVEAEKKAEQEQELRRRREQRDVQKLGEWKKEQEYKEAIETRRRERLEEKNARERILAKIASDKAERAQKFAVDGGAVPAAAEVPSAASSAAAPSAATAPDTTRLQFRFPNGVVSSHAFARAESLATVRAYIQAELTEQLAGLKEFTLATTYPKREFATDDEAKTLTELALFPSAVILVLGKATRHNAVLNETNRFAVFTFLLHMIMSPFVAIYNYFTKPRDGAAAAASSAAGKDSLSSGGSDNTDSLRREAAAKRRRLDGFSADSGQSAQSNEQPRRSTAARRYGGVNIHRLSDSPKDSDDENATWNGNSTQQQ